MSLYNESNITFSTIATTFVQQQQLLTNATNSSTSSECPSTYVHVLTFAIYGILIIVPLNGYFCYTVYKRPRLHNLSMVLSVKFSITAIIIFLFKPIAIYFEFEFIYLNAMETFSIVDILTTLTAISIERYLATNRPKFYKKHRTPVKMGFVVSIILIYSSIWLLLSFLVISILSMSKMKYRLLCIAR